MAMELNIARAVEIDPMLAGLISQCIGNATEEKVKAVWEGYARANGRE